MRPPFNWLWLLLFALAAQPLAVQAKLAPRDLRQDRALADALFTNGVVLTIQVEIARTNIDALRKTPHKYVPATVRVGSNVWTDVAVHLKGSLGSFRQVDDKPGLTLSFTTYEASDLFHGLKKFHLNNCVQDPTYISDWFCNEMFRRAGVPAPRCAHALVELNGRKLGLCVLMETIDRDFLSRYFTNTRGNVYGQPGYGEITDPLERMEGRSPLDRADLKALAAACQEPDPVKRYARLQQQLDVPRFLSFMALEVMLCDWDGYVNARHNYRVYQDLDTGRMVFIPHDKDQMIQDPNFGFLPPNLNANGLVAQTIMNTPEYRQLYRERVQEICSTIFKPDVLTNYVATYVSKILPSLQAWNPNFAREWLDNISGFKQRILARAPVLQRQCQEALPISVAFTSNIARLAQWLPVKEGNGKIEQVTVEEKPALYIKNENPNLCSWRTPPLKLSPGAYRFFASAKTAGVVPLPVISEAGSGGGIRVSGGRRANKLEGDAPWTTLAHEFTLAANAEVTLVCELRAIKGEIWFDMGSLTLERLK